MKRAIFTLEHQEQWFLPMWIKYYSQFFAPEDMYILAHNSDKIDTDCHVEYLNTDEIFNHDWLLQTVQGFQRELLKKYDYVVFTDCDEFLVPLDCDLGTFMDNAPEEAYRALGHDVQEDKMYLSHGFSKTLISRIPLIWCHGYHFSQPEFPINDRLHLYHLHFLSYKECWERNQRLAKEKWDAGAIRDNLGFQNRIDEKEAFDKMFYATGELTEHSEQLVALLDYLNGETIVS